MKRSLILITAVIFFVCSSSLVALAEVPCDQKNFKKFLTAFTKLSKEEQLSYVKFPLKVTLHESDEESITKTVKSPSFFKDHNKLILTEAEFRKHGWKIDIEKKGSVYEVYTHEDCDECSPGYHLLHFQWNGQCWQVIAYERG